MKKQHKTGVRLLVSACIIFGFCLLSSSSRFHSKSYALVEGVDIPAVSLKDGIFKGTATGFRSGLTLQVELLDNRIESIEITDHREIGRDFWEYPMKVIPQAIIKTQNTKVDSVSGATATSLGIMAAVEDALKLAVQ